jgi:hypothetical protein
VTDEGDVDDSTDDIVPLLILVIFDRPDTLPLKGTRSRNSRTSIGKTILRKAGKSVRE